MLVTFHYTPEAWFYFTSIKYHHIQCRLLQHTQPQKKLNTILLPLFLFALLIFPIFVDHMLQSKKKKKIYIRI